MRALADRALIERLMDAWGRVSAVDGTVYLTGGATAVLRGWRKSTLDVDVKLVPDRDELLRDIPSLKESLQINIELAAPSDFIPVPPGWEERSPLVRRSGRLAFRDFDPTAQALSKVERGHRQDLEDVAAFLDSGLVTRDGAWQQFESIEPLLFRFPAIDPRSFREAVEDAFGPWA